MNQEIAVPTTGQAVFPVDGTCATPRWLLTGFGLSLIFGLFGLWQLFLKNKA